MRRGRRMRVAALSFFALMSLGACGEPNSPQPTPNLSAGEEADGRYPALENARPGAEQISDEHFDDGITLLCDNPRSTATGLWWTLRAQLKGSRAKLVDWGVDPVQLNDGPGQVVAIEYTFEPGDPGSVVTETDFYLVNQNCHPLVWFGK